MEHILQPGQQITITAAGGPRITPTTFTREQVESLIDIADYLDQSDGSGANALKLAAQEFPSEAWAKQDINECAAGMCVGYSRHLEYVAYQTTIGGTYSRFHETYKWFIDNGLIGQKTDDSGNRYGPWYWQLDESKIYDFFPWPDLDRTIVNNYAVHCKPNWIDGKQYREWRRFCVVDEKQIPQYQTDGNILAAARGLMPSVLCLRDSSNYDNGTHTSVCVLYVASDGKYYYIMLDTAYAGYRGGILTATDEEHEAARNSPDEFVRKCAEGPRRFGPGTTRILHNAYTHVAASSVLMRAFAGSVS